MKQKAIGEETNWNVDNAGILKYKGKLWVSEELRKEGMKQAHKSSYTMHPRAIKMYQDLKKIYWWQGMKKDIFDYVIKCVTYQQVKAEHQRPIGLHQNIFILEWKWESLTVDFIVGLPITTKGYDSI